MARASTTPSVPRSSATTSGGTGVDVARHHQRRVARGALAEVHLVDVDAVVEPRMPVTLADHARAVLVAHHEHVARRRQLDDVVVDGDDAGRVVLAVQRARDVRRALGSGAAQLDEVHVVACRRRRRLAHDEPALLGELRRVDERHRLVDAPDRARP